MNLVPTVLAAVALGLSPEAVRKLAERGELTRYGTKTRALYDVAELTDLASERDTKRRKRRAA